MADQIATSIVNPVIPSVVTATAGFIGVLVGSFIAWLREYVKERKDTRNDMVFLCVLVMAHLEKLRDDLVAVSFDDGTYLGGPSGKDGQTCEPVVAMPTFDPLSLEVNWRVLSPNLMHEILHLPVRIEKLRKNLERISEIDSPPDYHLYFEERQLGSIRLAIDVVHICEKLRQCANLPKAPIVQGEWDRDYELTERRQKLEVGARNAEGSLS